MGSYVLGRFFLDKESLGGRRKRAIRGLILVSTINLGQWAYATAYQFSTGYDKDNQPEERINFSDGATYAVPMILFMYCGLADSLVQTYAYWILGALSNDTKTLSGYVGYYKGVQSFGAAMAWLIEYNGVLYRWQLLICFALAAAFIPPTLLVALGVKDTEEGAEEPKQLSVSDANDEVLYKLIN